MKILQDFRAGKMNLEERKLVPDSRKGRVKIVEDMEGLRHVQWGVDEGNDFVAEEDIIVLPDQAELRKVGPADERVYEFKFKDKSCLLFFWVQEANAEGDASICDSFNAIINGQVAGVSSSSLTQSTSSGGQVATGLNAALLSQMLSQAVESSQGGPSRPQQQQQQRQTLQQQAVIAAALLSSACGVPAKGIPKVPTGPSLAQVLQPDTLMKYIRQPEMLERLAEFLPESQKTQEALESQCLSPQLHQQLNVFSTALQSGLFDPAALGLDVEGRTTIDFLNAIQKLADREKSKGDDKEGASSS